MRDGRRVAVIVRGGAVSDAAARALRDDPHVVMDRVGDGTVAAPVAHTPVATGAVPAGTGNLVARDLRVPGGVDDALTVALEGADRHIDRRLLGEPHFGRMGGVGWTR